MSANAVSFASLILASYTWWYTPPEQSVQVFEVPAAAEFSCSAKCPTPASPHSFPVAPSAVSPFFWVIGSFLPCAILAWRVWPRAPPTPVQVHSTILALPALPAGPKFAEEHEERAQEGEVASGVTPQWLRLRRIRALRDASESGA